MNTLTPKMSFVKQIWTMPNTLEFNAIWKGLSIYLKASYNKSENEPYVYNGFNIECKPFPFLMYEGSLFVGSEGFRHDEMFNEFFHILNDPSVEVTMADGKYKCKEMRNAGVYKQQGRCFVFKIDDTLICIITTWKPDADVNLYSQIKEKIKADAYYYIHLNHFFEV